MVRTEAGPRPSPRPLRRAGVRVSCRPSRGSSHSPSCSPVSQSSGWLRSESPSQIAKTLSGVRSRFASSARPASKDGLAKASTPRDPPSPRSARATCRVSRGSVRYSSRRKGAARRCVLARLPGTERFSRRACCGPRAQSIRLGVSPPRRVMRDGSPAPVSVPSVAPWRKVSRHWTASSVPRRRRWSGPMSLALLIRGGRGPGSKALGEISAHDSYPPGVGIPV